MELAPHYRFMLYKIDYCFLYGKIDMHIYMQGSTFQDFLSEQQILWLFAEKGGLHGKMADKNSYHHSSDDSYFTNCPVKEVVKL